MRGERSGSDWSEKGHPRAREQGKFWGKALSWQNDVQGKLGDTLGDEYLGN